MNKTADLLIVSAYGRGHWLAGELARQNWSVHLVDVTGALGAWGPEDWEGPWGFFDTPELTVSQRSRLIDSDHAYPVPGGFTVWLPQGPLELSGELATFHSRAFGIHENVRAYLQPAPTAGGRVAVEEAPLAARASTTREATREAGAPDRPLPSAASLWLGSLTGGIKRPPPLKGRERLHKKISALSFDQGWIGHFAHSVAANVYVENHQAAGRGAPLPLAAPYGVRHVTKESFEAGLKALEQLGVRVTREATINDVRINNKVMDAIEIAAGRRGVDSARAFVWLLSAGESGFLTENIVRALYPSGPVNPAWFWARYRFRMKANSATRALPIGLAIIGNVCLPWTHANLMMVKRLRGEIQDDELKFDLWIRVPARVAGERSYFEALREEIASSLARRLPLSAPVCEELPAEADAAALAERALRWPVYLADDLAKLDVRNAKNLFIDGPEFWDGHDWMSQMRSQRAVLAALEKLRLQWEAAELRQGARA